MAFPGLRIPKGSRACFTSRITLEDVGADLLLQPPAFQCPDAVLAGDGAPERDGQVHHLAERQLRPGDRRRIGPIEDDQRVEVAVPRMADGGDERAALLRHPLDARDQVRHPGSGTPTSSMRTLPSFSTAGIAARRAAMNWDPSSSSAVEYTSSAPASRQASIMVRHFGHGLGPPDIGLAQQERTAIGESHVELSLHGRDRGAVHQLQHGGVPARGDRRDGMTRPLGVGKGRNHGGRRRGRWPKAEPYFGDHPQRPLAPGEEPLEVVTRHILDGAPPSRSTRPSASTTSRPRT